MKVLHVFKTSRPTSFGGIETFIDTLCSNSFKLGVKNTVFVLHPSPQKTPIEINTYTVYQAKQHFIFASTAFSFSAFGAFKELVAQNDLIHYHYPNPFADILHLMASPKKPCLVTYHSDIVKQKYLRQLYKPLQRHFLGSVKQIIATSPNYFATSKILQMNAEKVSVIPIGIEHQIYEKPLLEKMKFWQQQLPRPFFLFVGALRYYKGLHIALSAVAGTQIQIVIAGVSGMEKELKAQAQSLQLTNVKFLDAITEKDKVALLHLCYGFIFPSHLRSEAFGISLLEAAAVGKPLISSEIGTGTSFVNCANDTGIVVNPGSAPDLRTAMQYLLDKPNVAAKMGKNAKKRSLKLFTAEQQAKSYLDLYEKLLKKGT